MKPSALSLAAKSLLELPRPRQAHNLPLDLPEDADEELIRKARASGFVPRLNLDEPNEERKP